MGLSSFFLKISRNEEVTWKELFSKARRWSFWLGLSLLMDVYILLGSLLFVVIGIGLLAMGLASANYVLIYLGILLLVVPGFVIAIGVGINCSMANCIALDNPELGVRAVLKKSKQIMKGHRIEFVLLVLSFLGWLVFGLFTLGLLYLWVVPYMSVTLSNFYNEIKDEEV